MGVNRGWGPFFLRLFLNLVREVGDIISNGSTPPPPTILELYPYSLKWGPSFSPSFLSCQRGWWYTMGTPTLCLENWPKNVEVAKKKCRSHQLFSDLGDFRGWRRTDEKQLCVPPPPPPPHGLLRIDAHACKCVILPSSFSEYNEKHDMNKWRVCSQKPISPFLSIFKYGHHRIIQKIIFKMIPRSLHIKDYFWSYDQKYQKCSYYFLYISAASIANISIWQKWTYRFLRTNSSSRDWKQISMPTKITKYIFIYNNKSVVMTYNNNNIYIFYSALSVCVYFRTIIKYNIYINRCNMTIS